MQKRAITNYHLNWRSFRLLIRYQANYLWPGTDHIEVYVVHPKHAVIPITETGYRSHFIDQEELSLAGGAVNFITDWLDREAAAKKWKVRELAAQQLKLDL